MSEHQSPETQPPRRNSNDAVTAFVLGILGVVMCGPFTAVPAIIVGRKATREIDGSQGRLEGRGLAQAGLILGIVGTVLGGLAILFVILVFLLDGFVADTVGNGCTPADSDGITFQCD